MLMAGHAATGQGLPVGPVTEPGPPPIPAIPGIPSSDGSRPARKSPAFPNQAGPGVTVPGFTLPGVGGMAKVVAERLQPGFQPANTYRFVMRTELQTRTESGAAGGFTMEQQARFDAKVRVDGKKGIVLKGRSERLDLTLQSGGSTLSYQSLNPEDKETPLGRHIRATLNRPVDLTLDDKCRIDSALEGGTGDEAALLPGVPRFGPEELSQLVAGLPQSFSEKRVGPGDEWSLQGRRSVGGAGMVTFDISYRHMGQVNFEGQTCHSIEFAGTLAGNLPETGAANPSTVADFQTSALRGRIYFDPLDRMVRFSEQNIDLWITRPPSGTFPGTRIPVRQTTTLRLLHVVPTP